MKQAILIIANKNTESIRNLVKTFDDPRFDVYIHFDNKTANVEFESLKIFSNKNRKNKNVKFTERHDVQWAARSVVLAEISLFKMAVNNGDYSYYHLISGEDYPVKDVDYIWGFFEQSTGEWINFKIDSDTENRFKFYYFFMEFGVRKRNVWWAIQKITIYLQKMIGIRRRLPYSSMGYGSQWGSYTNDFAQYIASHDKEIARQIKFTSTPDEHYKPGIILNESGKFITNQNNLRYIKFSSGNSPLYLSKETMDMARRTDAIFARKVNDDFFK